MSNLNSLTASNPTNSSAGLPHQRALTFLEQNPALSESLLADIGADLSRVATIIEPVLAAPTRCEISSFYIQAVTTGRTAFLTTNLLDARTTHVTETGTSWLVGRNCHCAIAIPNSSISRCHSVIGHYADRGFYIMDLGSSNGTYVNRRRLQPQQQRFLKDGDLVELSTLRVEFFITGWKDKLPSMQETQI